MEKFWFVCFIWMVCVACVRNPKANIISVEKNWYETIAHYRFFDRVYTPYEIDMLYWEVETLPCYSEKIWLEVPTAYCEDIWTKKTENECPIYCNSVGCWCDEEAFNIWDKIPNTDEHKFDYVNEQWMKNYFERSKFK